ncbi:hypothetical protein NFI96_019222 [Prochilodus magdalenae]|nr:hypothetical protein NFI96_019222 [Prochilodus magdalenae]
MKEMGDIDADEEAGFPMKPEQQEDQNEDEQKGCCDRFHYQVSRWMLPEDLRETYLERANCLPPPIFIILVSIGELAVFIYYAVWKPQKQWVTVDDGIWNSPLTYKPDHREEAWRFVSYMFVHAGIQHIVGNLILQLLLGIPLELVHKGFEVGMVYVGGVLAGSLASSIFDPYSALVGASGGVYALIGGYLMNAVVNFREMLPLLGIFRILVIVLIVGTDVGFALYRRFLSDEVGLKTKILICHVLVAIRLMSNRDSAYYLTCHVLVIESCNGQRFWLWSDSRRLPHVTESRSTGYPTFTASDSASHLTRLTCTESASPCVTDDEPTAHLTPMVICLDAFVPSGFSVITFQLAKLSTVARRKVSPGGPVQGLESCPRPLIGVAQHLLPRLGFEAPSPTWVSFVAHIGGGIAGMTIGYVFFSNYNQKLLKDPRFWFCIVGYIVFLLFAVFFNIFLSPAPR